MILSIFSFVCSLTSLILYKLVLYSKIKGIINILHNKRYLRKGESMEQKTNVMRILNQAPVPLELQKHNIF